MALLDHYHQHHGVLSQSSWRSALNLLEIALRLAPWQRVILKLGPCAWGARLPDASLKPEPGHRALRV